MLLKDKNVLFYDIETGLLLANVFRPGEQVVRSNQLIDSTLVTPIITISYAMNKEPVQCLKVDPKDPNSTHKIMEKFKTLIDSADIVIGKNNHRFDDKHINTQAMLMGLDLGEAWLNKSDDLEKQLRRYFAFPSNSLDHISRTLGLGGKDKMDFSDWVSIKQYMDCMAAREMFGEEGSRAIAEVMYVSRLENIIKKGIKALNKMAKYNKKDVEDTRTIWYYLFKHVKHKHTYKDKKQFICTKCGSDNVRKNGMIRIESKTGKKVTYMYCNNHQGCAGKVYLDESGKDAKSITKES